jgi:hypothetical protein
VDVVSHALWGYAILRWRVKTAARWGALTGAAPDLLYFSASVVGRVATRGWAGLTSFPKVDRAVWFRDGPPMPQELLDAYWNYYVWTHSFVVLGLLALAWWALRRRAPWLLLPWALHIFMDIPSHERYLTPFLYPLSTFTVEGCAWSRPPMLIANYGALLVTYAALAWRYRRRRVPNALARYNGEEPSPADGT